MSGLCVCFYKGRMVLKGLFNLIVYLNLNKVALVYSWFLIRVYIFIFYIYFGGLGDRFGVYINVY